MAVGTDIEDEYLDCVDAFNGIEYFHSKELFLETLNKFDDLLADDYNNKLLDIQCNILQYLGFIYYFDGKLIEAKSYLNLSNELRPDNIRTLFLLYFINLKINSQKDELITESDDDKEIFSKLDKLVDLNYDDKIINFDTIKENNGLFNKELPDEVISIIIKQLSFKDFNSLSLVCKKWFKILHGLDDLELKINLNLDNIEDFFKLLSYKRDFTNVQISRFDFISYDRLVNEALILKIFKSGIRIKEMFYNTNDEIIFFNIQLSKLFHTNIFNGLRKLKIVIDNELNLVYELLTNVYNLEELNLRVDLDNDCDIGKEFEKFGEIIHLSKLKKFEIHSNRKIFKFLKKLDVKNIEELVYDVQDSDDEDNNDGVGDGDGDDDDNDDKMLKKYLMKKDNKLRKLQLRKFYDNKSIFLNENGKLVNFNNITKLELNYCEFKNAGLIDEQFNTKIKIKELILDHCSLSNNEFLNIIRLVRISVEKISINQWGGELRLKNMLKTLSSYCYEREITINTQWKRFQDFGEQFFEIVHGSEVFEFKELFLTTADAFTRIFAILIIEGKLEVENLHLHGSRSLYDERLCKKTEQLCAHVTWDT